MSMYPAGAVPPPYGPQPPAAAPGSDPRPRREPLALAAAGLGALTFLVGFLPFYTSGDNGISGYALGTPTSAAIGFSVLAGLITAAGLLPRPGQPPLAAAEQLLAAAAALTALLLAVANLLSKGSLSGDVAFGFVLFLLSVLAQAAVLVYSWLVATGRMASLTGSAPAVRSGGAPVQYGPPPGYPAGPGGAGSPGVTGAPYPGSPYADPGGGPVVGPFYPPAGPGR